MLCDMSSCCLFIPSFLHAVFIFRQQRRFMLTYSHFLQQHINETKDIRVRIRKWYQAVIAAAALRHPRLRCHANNVTQLRQTICFLREFAIKSDWRMRKVSLKMSFSLQLTTLFLLREGSSNVMTRTAVDDCGKAQHTFYNKIIAWLLRIIQKHTRRKSYSAFSESRRGSSVTLGAADFFCGFHSMLIEKVWTEKI